MNKKLALLVVFVLLLGLAVTCTSTKAPEPPKELALLPYQAVDFSGLIGMKGFSEALLTLHFKLYQGYVTNTNLLLDKIKEYAQSGRADAPEYAELKRRLGFEFNGMRLHEYYFGNLGGSGALKEDNALYRAIAVQFGSFAAWKQDFLATGTMRGIGWVVLYEDMTTGRLINMWVNEHETGHLTGCNPLLVMDVFEHAYLLDYGLDRAGYIQAFFKNIDWGTVAERFGIDAAKVVEPVAAPAVGAPAGQRPGAKSEAGVKGEGAPAQAGAGAASVERPAAEGAEGAARS